MIMSQTVVFPEAVPPETPAQHPLERVNDFNKSEKKKKKYKYWGYIPADEE